MYTLFHTAVGTECQHVVRFMGPCTSIMGRLDLRPETCPPLNTSGFQDLRSAGNTGLFLGLFDVTRCWRVAVDGRYGTVGTVWHCFDDASRLY